MSFFFVPSANGGSSASGDVALLTLGGWELGNLILFSLAS